MDAMRGICAVYSIEAGAQVYIGATKNIRDRWADHLAGLLDGTHDNRALQAACDKFGVSTLRFRIIEMVYDRSELGAREQFWLDHYRITLNAEMVNPSTSARLVGMYAPGRMKGVPKSEEHRAKIGKAQAAAWKRDDGTRKAALVRRNRAVDARGKTRKSATAQTATEGR